MLFDFAQPPCGTTTDRCHTQNVASVNFVNFGGHIRGNYLE